MSTDVLAKRPEQAAEFIEHFGFAAERCNLVVADAALRREGDIMRTKAVPVPMTPDQDLYKPAGAGGKLALTAAGISKLLNAAGARVQVVKVPLPPEQQAAGDVAYEAEVRIRNADGSERVAPGRYDWIAADQREVARKRAAGKGDGQAEYDKAFEHRDGLAQTKAVNRAARKALGLTSISPDRAALPWVVTRAELNTESREPAVIQGIVAAVTGFGAQLYGRPISGLGQGGIVVEQPAALPPACPADEADSFPPDDEDEPQDEEPDEEAEREPVLWACCDCGQVLDDAQVQRCAKHFPQMEKPRCGDCALQWADEHPDESAAEPAPKPAPKPKAAPATAQTWKAGDPCPRCVRAGAEKPKKLSPRDIEMSDGEPGCFDCRGGKPERKRGAA